MVEQATQNPKFYNLNLDTTSDEDRPYWEKKVVQKNRKERKKIQLR